MSVERWAPVVGWEEAYEVSDLGQVRSRIRHARTKFGLRAYGGQILSLIARRYVAVNLTFAGRREQKHVHRMVLEAFAGPRQSDIHCCHSNGDPHDNRLGNLRWDTAAGNCADKCRHGSAQNGERNPRAKLTAVAVAEIRQSKKSGPELAKQFGVSASCINYARKGKTWAAAV